MVCGIVFHVWAMKVVINAEATTLPTWRSGWWLADSGGDGCMRIFIPIFMKRYSRAYRSMSAGPILSCTEIDDRSME